MRRPSDPARDRMTRFFFTIRLNHFMSDFWFYSSPYLKRDTISHKKQPISFYSENLGVIQLKQLFKVDIRLHVIRINPEGLTVPHPERDIPGKQ